MSMRRRYWWSLAFVFIAAAVVLPGLWLPRVQVVEAGMPLVDEAIPGLAHCLDRPNRWQAWGVEAVFPETTQWRAGATVLWRLNPGEILHWTLATTDWREGMVFSAEQGLRWVIALDEDEGWLSLVEERDVGPWPWKRLWWFKNRRAHARSLEHVLLRMRDGCLRP